MKFFHGEFSSIARFSLSQGLLVFEQDCEAMPVSWWSPLFHLPLKRRPARPPQPRGLGAAGAYFDEAEGYLGAAAISYLHFSALPPAGPLPLARAIAQVEGQGGPADFLLVGFNDGGAISVSRHLLPFQEHADPAGGWMPG